MRLKQSFVPFVVATMVGVCASTVHAAAISAAGTTEVEQLLTRLAASDCQFNRNGSWYSSAEARDHLNRKYQYALDKKLIASSDEFISVVGSKSSSSGSAYAVKCGASAQQPSAEWLNNELRKLRASKSSPSK